MNKHPDQVQAGEITEIYHKLKTGLRDIGFVLEWRGTAQALQFTLPDEYDMYSSKKWDNLGAIQYYTDDDSEEKPPGSVGLKFYRANLPSEKWLNELEAVREYPYRQDKSTGPEVDESALYIQFIFSDYDKDALAFIDGLLSLLENLLIEGK